MDDADEITRLRQQNAQLRAELRSAEIGRSIQNTRLETMEAISEGRRNRLDRAHQELAVARTETDALRAALQQGILFASEATGYVGYRFPEMTERGFAFIRASREALAATPCAAEDRFAAGRMAGIATAAAYRLATEIEALAAVPEGREAAEGAGE